MEYTNLGATGLRVSRVCLGMMSFGDDGDRPWVLDEAAAEPIVRAAWEGGVTFFDTADVYSNGASEVATGRLLRKLATRDEVVVATKVFFPITEGENAGGLSRKHILVGHRRVARAPGDGPRRPLPDPSLGPAHADRGDDGGAARRRPRRQGALHRGQLDVRVAVRQGPARRRAQRLDAVRLDAEPRQPRLPRGGARDAPALRRPGRRRDPVEPARARDARRQPRPHRHRAVDRARGDRQRSPTRSTSSRATRRSSRACTRSPRSAGCRRRRSRWPGCCTSPRSPRPSSARRSPATSTTRWRAVDVALTPEEDRPPGGALRAPSGARPRLILRRSDVGLDVYQS